MDSAVYVRMRRSQGASDATIAKQFGQRSGPGLIVSTYGGADIRGDGRWDGCRHRKVRSRSLGAC